MRAKLLPGPARSQHKPASGRQKHSRLQGPHNRQRRAHGAWLELPFPGGLRMRSGPGALGPEGSVHQVPAAPLREPTEHRGGGAQLHSMCPTLWGLTLCPASPREERAGGSFRKWSSPHRKLVLDSFFSFGWQGGRVLSSAYHAVVLGTQECQPCTEGLGYRQQRPQTQPAR